VLCGRHIRLLLLLSPMASRYCSRWGSAGLALSCGEWLPTVLLLLLLVWSQVGSLPRLGMDGQPGAEAGSILLLLLLTVRPVHWLLHCCCHSIVPSQFLQTIYVHVSQADVICGVETEGSVGVKSCRWQGSSNL
jgi:hypothetical protein